MKINPKTGLVMGRLSDKNFEGLSTEGPEENCDCEQCGQTKSKGQYCELFFGDDYNDYCWSDEAIICDECLEEAGL